MKSIEENKKIKYSSYRLKLRYLKPIKIHKEVIRMILSIHSLYILGANHCNIFIETKAIRYYQRSICEIQYNNIFL